MITLSDYLKSWKAEDGQPDPIAHLYEIDVSDAVTLRFAQGDPTGTRSVVYNGNTYPSAAIAISEDEQTIEGDLAERKLSVSNIDGIAGGYIETQDLEGREVRIIHVPVRTLSPGDAMLESYTIQSQSYDRKTATATLGYPNLTKRKVPWRRFQRHRCQHDWVGRFLHENGCGFPSDYFGPDSRQSLFHGAVTNEEQVRRHGWRTLNALQSTSFEVDGAAAPNMLYIETFAEEISWNGQFRNGPFLYKLLTGDFDCFTEVLQFDTRSGSLCGILCQEAVSGQDTFVLWGVGKDLAGDGQARLAIGIDSTQQADSDHAVTENGFLRLRRVGNVFTFFHAATVDVSNPTAGWTELVQKTVAMDADVRLGLALTASSSQNTRIAVGFEFLRFIAGGPAFCDQGFEQCSEYGNTRRFFGMRGIPVR